MARKLNNILKTLGPGLMFAGCAIGVSHLVQSTRAGAKYGFAFVIFILLANLFKYPFFEFGPRYSAATGKSLLEGYRLVGKWALWLFVIFTLLTMFIGTAAVTIVTAGLAEQVFGLGWKSFNWSLVITAVCCAILFVGHFRWLNKLMKAVVLVLAVTTLIAFVAAVIRGSSPMAPDFVSPAILTVSGITFLVSFMGWMPAPIELSVWHSIWSKERNKDEKENVKIKDELLDFNVGYICTIIMALIFLSLVALIMFGTGAEFPSSAAAFAGQLISLYTSALGQWSWWVIAVAALITMFTTTLTILDGYPRVLQSATQMAFPDLKYNNHTYKIWLLVVIAGALFILAKLVTSMKGMIVFATVMSFLVAPVFAYLNFRVITHEHLPEEARPPKWLIGLSYLGLIFLVGFSILFVVVQFVL